MSLFLVVLGLIFTPQTVVAQQAPSDPAVQLQETLQSLLDAQNDLPTLVVDSAVQAPNCFEVASLDEEALPSGSKNLVLVMVIALATRLELAPSLVLEQTKTQLIDEIEEFLSEEYRDIGDLPPIDNDEGGDDRNKSCTFAAAGEYTGPWNSIGLAGDIQNLIAKNYVSPHEGPQWDEFEMWINLRDVLRNGKLVASLGDVTHEYPRPAPFGSGAYWNLPPIERTVYFVCKKSLYPAVYPYAVFELTSLVRGLPRYNNVWTLPRK